MPQTEAAPQALKGNRLKISRYVAAFTMYYEQALFEKLGKVMEAYRHDAVNGKGSGEMKEPTKRQLYEWLWICNTIENKRSFHQVVRWRRSEAYPRAYGLWDGYRARFGLGDRTFRKRLIALEDVNLITVVPESAPQIPRVIRPGRKLNSIIREIYSDEWDHRLSTYIAKLGFDMERHKETEPADANVPELKNGREWFRLPGLARRKRT